MSGPVVVVRATTPTTDRNLCASEAKDDCDRARRTGSAEKRERRVDRLGGPVAE